MKKRLTKSRDQKVLAGVMGGIGEYLNTDPVFVRVLYLFATVFSGLVPGIIGYILAALIIPEAPHSAAVPDDTSTV
jgi:phage shock protein C